MSSPEECTLRGECGCGKIRFGLTSHPLFVHCCHCTTCQRETGSAFIINALIETSRIVTTGPEPLRIVNPTASGRGQTISRCPTCHVAVWSNYGDPRDLLRFVRVGALDRPHDVAPDIHIWARSKVPWVDLRGVDAPVVDEFYDRQLFWPRESLERLKALTASREKM